MQTLALSWSSDSVLLCDFSWLLLFSLPPLPLFTTEVALLWLLGCGTSQGVLQKQNEVGAECLFLLND